MEPTDKNEALELIKQLKQDKELNAEFESKFGAGKQPERRGKGSRKADQDEFEAAPPEEMELEAVVAQFRPVLIIRDNKVVPEFVGREVEVWKNRIMEKQDILNKVIPAVGRINVKNNINYSWVGTGWLVKKDVIVTNRHVASLFSRGVTTFSFLKGYPDGEQSASLDFLEEDKSDKTFEFVIDHVIWMAPNEKDQPDIAFLRLKDVGNVNNFPEPITLASNVDEGEVVVTIGYPARDENAPDQKLVQSIFKNVYDKKRLAPGTVKKLSSKELQHDCSTLGGNSGSAVVSLATGKAVGLHFAGLYMKANYAVPCKTIKELLNQLDNKTLPGMCGSNESPGADSGTPLQNINQQGTYTFELNIPIKITVEVGAPVMQGIVQSAETPTFDKALEAAKKQFEGRPGINEVRRGYKFENGWITDKQVIVVETTDAKVGAQGVPSQYLNVPVEIRPVSLLDQLAEQELGINLRGLEAPPKSGSYQEPPSPVKLERVEEEMSAIFHVSPDSGFPNLKKFISRIEKNLVGTIYEWEPNHISKALANTLSKAKGKGKLKMVTQRPGTKDAVDDMIKLAKKGKFKFDHVWASVGAGRLFPSAYHIKVAVRDHEEFWLSSGNWKDSNQADIDPAGDASTAIMPLRQHNREWHVIIANDKLAKMFESYINWDFEEAQRVPLEEAAEAPPVYLLVPEEITEAPGKGKYFKPLIIENQKLDIQALLTPDRDSDGHRIFIDSAISLIGQAKSEIYIENQSFNYLEANLEDFERFFTTLRTQQENGVKIQVIFRDTREFGSSNKKLLERLKGFGLDMDNIKVQKKCHTKAIIIDPSDDKNATVLFGSHNLTNAGTLYNRDASLIVRDAEVTRYYKQIFDFDWEVLAKQDEGDDEPASRVRVAKEDEATPPGFRKVLLSDILY